MNLEINLLKNLVGNVSDQEIKYQLNNLHEKYKKTGFKVLAAYIGKISDREINYQLENLKEEA